MMDVIGALLLVVLILAAAVVGLLIHEQRSKHALERLCASEREFHNTLDRAPIMIWAARPDTSVKYLNQTCVEFTGMRMEALLDNGWLAAVHPEDIEGCIRTYAPAIQAHESFDMEYRLRRADGIYRWIQDTGVPSFGPEGDFTGYVGCAVDITDRKNAQDVIHESRAALAGKHREIQQLAGRLLTAHEDERRHLARELHDDLTQRLARLAIDAGQMEQVAGAVVGLRSLREDLVRLSEDVHALSYRLHPSVLDDLGLVEAIKAECDRVARRGSLRVDVDAYDVPDSLSGDTPLCLFRIVQEALSNAARHANASTVTVLLASEGSGLQLAVSDDGDGFDPWGPRDHPSLGLASMRERIRIVHGELEIDSFPGRGTTVIAWVPV
jgi:PAS domain S-box-containing protein